ncbi:hypothetical protein V502_02497 [Pseudogymnoascus sp. VKM F-4520 (FW-2644)]|nr:hypothetical protein V502_02497 [Pseudogymnoascus sp. VKM F-4520 (FW-2644)]
MASVNERQVRSKTGCLVCKSRKVKCDEKPEGCDNCGRLGVQCPGYDATPKLHRTAQADAVVNIFDTAGVPKKVTNQKYEMPEILDEEDFLAPNPPNGNYYADGDGVQSGDSNQTWIYDYENLDNKGKCWTEVFFVGTTLAYAEWKQIGPDHDCASTVSWLGIELTATLTTTVGQTYQACNTHTDSENCTWDDEKSHSIWGADQTLTVHGFKRLSCPGPGKVDGVLLRPDGNFIVTTINFAIPLPAPPYTGSFQLSTQP